MGAGMMSGYTLEPTEPLEEEIELYNKMVALYLEECRRLNPQASSEKLLEMAEEMAARYFFQNQEAKRPH